MKKKRTIKIKKSSSKEIIFMFLRYIVLLGLMFTPPLIYKFLTPLTVYLTAFLLNPFYPVLVSNDIIAILPNTLIKITPPCVAGSAYLLLLILNLSLPLKPKTRIYSVLFSTVLLFILNLSRIFLLAVLLVNNSVYFDFTHKLFWYILSTVFVVGIWFLTSFLFKIRQIPVYSDIRFLVRIIKKK